MLSVYISGGNLKLALLYLESPLHTKFRILVGNMCLIWPWFRPVYSLWSCEFSRMNLSGPSLSHLWNPGVQVSVGLFNYILIFWKNCNRTCNICCWDIASFSFASSSTMIGGRKACFSISEFPGLWGNGWSSLCAWTPWRCTIPLSGLWMWADFLNYLILKISPGDEVEAGLISGMTLGKHTNNTNLLFGALEIEAQRG